MTTGAEAARRVRVTPRAVILGLVVVVLGASAVPTVRDYLAQRSDIEDLQRSVERLEAERVRLEDRIERLHDPDYLERLARECLGMVRPGEIAFVVPGEEQPDPDRC